MNILLIRTSALGDVVHALPVLTALRQAWPTARIGWVVEKVWAPILRGHPWIDVLIEVRTKAWRRNLWRAGGEIRETLAAMRRFAPDITFDLMGNHKGALLARGSGAARIVGARRHDRREGSSALWVNERVATPGVHAVDRSLALLRAVDLEPGPADFRGDLLLRAIPEGAALPSATSARPLVLIQAGAGWVNKIYPRWAAVAKLLAEAGCEVVLPSAPGEEALLASIAAESGGAARVVDARDFAVAAAWMRRARLLIGGDTGPLHLAHALGTPVLCVIGPTDPARNGPYGAPEAVVFHPLACSYCYRRFAEAKACLLNIAPATIVARARQVLAEVLAEGLAERLAASSGEKNHG